MKISFVLFITIYFLVSCVSVKKYNTHLNDLRTEKQLKSDVDFAYRKLQKLHPHLYWYISKKELDFKFDSLKSTINAPMTSNDFYLKFSPVIASVKEGHLRLFQLNKKLKQKEKLALPKIGISPLSQLEFERFESKVYIVKNNSADTSIRVGTEVISVNGIKPQELISKYCNTFTSDGFNRTFIERRLSTGLSYYFYYQNGVTDSVSCQFKYNDSLMTVCLKRKQTDSFVKKGKRIKPSVQEIEKARVESKKRQEMGYDGLTRTYSKNLSFFERDSSIAVMKINDFYKGHYKKFFSNSFKMLDSLKTKTLILDLRDNSGGKLREVYNLYSYLVDSDYYFVDKSEVTSKFSLMHTVNFRGMPLFVKAIFIAFSPLRLIGAGIICVKVRKKENKFYYTWRESKLGHSNPNRFNGKLYVLINGGSFSATSLLSANLKGSKRAFFVGEETGGAYNGTVAGIMPTIILPKSKLRIVFGLAYIQPHYKTDLDGRGILPDIAINPTLEDRVKGNDPELNWVMDEVKGLHKSNEN